MKMKRTTTNRMYAASLSIGGFLLLLFLLFVEVGCGNTPSTDTQPTNTTTAGRQTTDTAKADTAGLGAQSAAKIDCMLQALYLDRDDFLTLSRNPQANHKFVLQVYQQAGSDKLTLALYPASQGNQRFDPSRVKHPIAFETGINISGKEVYLGDQQMKPHDFRELVDSIRGNNAINYVIFVPDINAEKHLYYKITGTDKKEVPTEDKLDLIKTATFSSNPSPPAGAL